MFFVVCVFEVCTQAIVRHVIMIHLSSDWCCYYLYSRKVYVISSKRRWKFEIKHYSNWLYQYFSFYSKLRPEDQIQYTISEKKDKRIPKAHVNAIFFRQLRDLLRKYWINLFYS